MTLEVHTSELRAIDRMSPVLRQVATEGRQLGQSLSQSFSQAGESARRFNFDRAVIAGGLRELQGVASDFARAATEEAAGQERLQQAISNTGRSYDDVAGRIENLIKVGTDLSFADDQVVEGLTRLVNTTGDTTVAMDNLGLAMDLARARNIDLATAADLVGKVAAGNTSILSRYGIIIEEGATATEALAMMQQRFAGHGQTYADSTQGFIDRLSNSVADFGENLFSQNQELQTFLSLMPGVNAAYSILAAGIAGLGGVGVGGGLLAAVALLAGAGVAGYDLTANSQNAGGSTTENLLAGGLAWSAGAIKKITPGSVGDALFDDVMEQYRSIIRSNDFEAAVKSVLLMPGESDPDILYSRLATLLGIAPGSMTESQFQSYVKNQAAAQGQTVGGYVLNTAATNSNFVQDPLTGRFIPRHVYQTYQNERYFAGGGQTGSGAFTMAYGNLMTPFDPYYGRGAFAPPGIDYGLRFPSEQAGSLPPPGGAGIVANSGLANYNAPVVLSPEMQKAADRTAIINAIGDENMAYFGLVEGINSADDALKAFHATQANVLEQESVYSAQISEFSSQVNAQDAAYEILNKRREEGIALTDQETQFLNNYAEANERGTGAVEDATVAQGMLAQQYLLNMKQGDELNRTLAGNTDATSSLVAVIYDLILAMDGIPPEVRSRIEIERAQESLGELAGIASWLNSLNGFTANAYVNVTRTGISLGSPDGVGISLNGLQLGGLIPGAAHGRVMGGGYTLVGEAGPELIAGGQGGMVIPASATRARLRGGAGGDTFQFNAPIMVYANNPQQFAAQMREQYVGGARQ